MELLERFAQGELEAFETLFRQFQGGKSVGRRDQPCS